MNLKRVLWILFSTAVLVATVWAWMYRPPTSAAAAASVPEEASSADPGWFGAFITDYTDRHGETDDAVMTQLLYSSNSVCGDLVAGNTLAEAWQMLVEHGQSSDQAATVIELSIKYYCPQFTDLYEEVQ